ncbi:hypothetical protein [Caenispirillum salinarum]|uniref:hypothetical protein n=1 Tax=Caenispirillum salinarum TaxID=859058 RepID=UPI00384EB313
MAFVFKTAILFLTFPVSLSWFLARKNKGLIMVALSLLVAYNAYTTVGSAMACAQRSAERTTQCMDAAFDSGVRAEMDRDDYDATCSSLRTAGGQYECFTKSVVGLAIAPALHSALFAELF